MISRRRLLQAGAASLALSQIRPAQGLFVPQAVWFPGDVVLNQRGPTPDVVQGAIAFDPDGVPLPPVVRAGSFTFTAALRIPPGAFRNTHTDSGLPVPIEYMTILESQFPDQPFVGGHFIYLLNDDKGGVDLRVVLLSDAYGTDFMTLYANGIFQCDDDWHLFQLLVSPARGTADYAIDGVPASDPITFPGGPTIPHPIDVGGWTGPFTVPVEGMYWQIGADTPENIYAQWNTTYVGGMAEVGLSHGPAETVIPTTLGILNKFVEVRGSFINAKRLFPHGLPILGSAPTIYLTGGAVPGADTPDFLDGDVSWFEGVLGVGAAPILPWIQQATQPDLDGDANIPPPHGILTVPSSDPYAPGPKYGGKFD